MTTETVIDPTQEGALTGMDIPPEVLALAAENPSEAIGTILAGQVGDTPVDSGDAAAPSLDQLAAHAEGQFGGAAKVNIGEGQRVPWITLWRAIDGLPRKCMLVYTDSSGKNHDYGMKYLKKRHTSETAPEHPEFWGKPIFLPRPPRPEDAPMHPMLAAACPRCGKKMNDEFEVDRHMKKKHPSDHERLEAIRTRDDSTMFQSAITTQNEQIVKLIGSIVNPGSKAAPSVQSATPVGGVFHYARDARHFYDVSKDHLLNQVRDGKIAGAKDPKGVWMVWVPDADWSPPEA